MPSDEEGFNYEENKKRFSPKLGDAGLPGLFCALLGKRGEHEQCFEVQAAFP